MTVHKTELSPLGRSITPTPIRPTMVAIQRPRSIGSLRNRPAPNVTKMA
jgi:hypothetical protein